MLLEKTRIKSVDKIVTLYLYSDKVVQRERIDGKYYQTTLTKEPSLTKWYYNDFIRMHEDHAHNKGDFNAKVTFYI